MQAMNKEVSEDMFETQQNDDTTKDLTQETKDLLDFEQWILNTDFNCVSCGSSQHCSGLCKQNDAIYDPRYLMCLDDISLKEQVARQKLLKGIPQDAGICKRHNDELQALMSQKGLYFDPDATVPGSTDGILSQTALLPLCYPCFQRKTLQIEGQHWLALDTCHCATAITASSCWTCAVGRIELTKSKIVDKYTTMNSMGEQVVSCGCGAIVGNEAARICGGCGGIVTLHTKSFTGDELTFYQNTTMPTVVRTASELASSQLTSSQPTSASTIPSLHAQPGHSRTLASKPPIANGRSTPNHRSVKCMLKEQSNHRPPAKDYVRASQCLPERQHVVFTAADISSLKALGLEIDGPIHDTDVHTALDPRSRLTKLVESLREPYAALGLKAVEQVLMVCGFRMMDIAMITAAVGGKFGGTVRADNMGILVSTALDTFRSPRSQDVPDWIEDCEKAKLTRASVTAASPRPAEPMEDVEMGDGVD